MEKSTQHVAGIYYYFMCLYLALLVHAQYQSGFISIDCGTSKNSSYTDKTTGINYVSDESFIESGVSKTISTDLKTKDVQQQFWNVRVFNEGTKNCYKLKPAEGKGNKYLIRASFMYGNYDGQSKLPVFDLYIGSTLWSAVRFENLSSAVIKEVIHIPYTSNVYVCLVNTGFGTPFLSALELRVLKNNTYRTVSQSMALNRRWDMGSTTNMPVRYRDDDLDRIWRPWNSVTFKPISTKNLTDVQTGISYPYLLPTVVMQSAVTSENSSLALSFQWSPDNRNSEFHIFAHFNEVEKVLPDQVREFTVFFNEVDISGPFIPDYLLTTTFSTILRPVSGDKIYVDMYPTKRSTLAPLLNALETFLVLPNSPLTYEQDVDALLNIKSLYGVKKSWQGDPCVPTSLSWDGLNCSYDSEDPFVRVTYLNLSSNGLSGEIAAQIADLKWIAYLDLSNNSLTGSIPGFLSQMPNLTILDLRHNNLTGSVPDELIQRSTGGSLSLRIEGNPSLSICTSNSCGGKKKKSYTIPIVAASVASFVVLVTIAILISLRRKNRARKVNDDKKMRIQRLGSIESKRFEFSYTEVTNMTNNFEKEIGKGGFATVYYGYSDETGHVAVKVLFSSSDEGYKEFQTEVKLLLRVHHRNLTSLVGYCVGDTKMILLYEYMANGNLATYMSDKNPHILTWEQRLRIVVDSAQGLEYLHDGCRPPIVHRDVKSANILLNEKLEAKIADFGISKSFGKEGTTHVSTRIAGTRGYLDPEYCQSSWLTEKSDVYSFGVVLLEIITNRPALIISEEKPHIVQWVNYMLTEDGDLRKVVDKGLRNDFDPTSGWKFIDIAMACLSLTPSERPTMNQVVLELKECLATEIAWKRNGSTKTSRTSNLQDSDMFPLAR